jgi:hypothetical protein
MIKLDSYNISSEPEDPAANTTEQINRKAYDEAEARIQAQIDAELYNPQTIVADTDFANGVLVPRQVVSARSHQPVEIGSEIPQPVTVIPQTIHETPQTVIGGISPPSIAVKLCLSGKMTINIPLLCQKVVKTEKMVVLITDKQSCSDYFDFGIDQDCLENLRTHLLWKDNGSECCAEVVPPVPCAHHFDLDAMRCFIFICVPNTDNLSDDLFGD